MSNYSGGMAICPFYQREARLSIICEGYTPQQNLMMRFESEAEKQRWQQEYCLRYYYPRCPLAATILHHYRQKESGREDFERFLLQ